MFDFNDKEAVSKLGKKVDDMEKNVRDSFRNLKYELEDHLDSINDNTNEVEYFAEVLIEFENRLGKLEQAIYGITDKLKVIVPDNERMQNGPRLNERETDIFLSIFRSESNPIALGDISKQTGLTTGTIKKTIQSMAHKDIPIIQTNTENGRYFMLEDDFRDKQTKYNVLNLSTTLTLDLFDQKVKEN